MSNLEPTRNGTAAPSKAVAIAAALAAAALALVGAWLVSMAGGRSDADAALVTWIEPMRAQASAVERDVSETDRRLRIFLFSGRDAAEFEAKRAELGKSLEGLKGLTGSANRETHTAANALITAVNEKYLAVANEIYNAAKAESQESARTAIIARLGPKDPLEDLRNERDTLAAALADVRAERFSQAAANDEARKLWLGVGFALVLAAAAIAFWLALRGTGPKAAPAGSLDLGLLRAVLDQLPDGIAIFGEDGRVMVSNLAASRMISPWDDGTNRLTLFRADGQAVLEDQSPLARALDGQHIHEREYFAERLDGSLCPVDVHAEPILDNGRATAAIIVVRDQSDSQRVEAEARAIIERAEAAEANAAELARRLLGVERDLADARASSEALRSEIEDAKHKVESRTERFDRLVAGGGPIGVSVFGAAELRLLETNEAGLGVLGERRRARDVRGSTLDEIVPGAEASGLADLFRKVVASGEPYASEEYYAQGLRHGAAYWRFALVPLSNEPGAPVDELVLLGVDITSAVEQRAATASREQKDQWPVEDILLAISNDLRTPILSIKGMVELFRQKYAEAVPDVTALHYLELTQRNADQIATLIDELVDLSNISHAEVKTAEIPLAAAIEEAWRASSRHGVELRIAGPLPTVRADRALLMRGFRDLFDTAARLKRDGDGAWMHVRVRDDGERWEIELSDNGKGAGGEHEAERLFGPLARHAAVAAATNGGPTLVGGGLGLAALRRIAELHGGDASVEAGETEGTVYRFTLEK
jgi:PAS domain S-box-containing protein